MRKLLFVMLSMLMPLAAWCAADAPTFTANATAVTAGEVSDLAIGLNNGDLVCNGYQFVLNLPNGVTLAYDDEEDDYVYTLGNRYTKKRQMQLTISQQGEGKYKIICFSMTNETITGSEGTIITFGLHVDEGMPDGVLNGSVTAIALSDAEGHSVPVQDTPFTIDVTAKPLDPITVTVTSCTRLYGDENPAFEYTIQGGELTGEPVITCEATPESPVGTYDIVIGEGTIVYSNLILVNGMLTVDKAPLTITAADCTIKQGDALPDFEVGYQGFKNDETAAVLTKQPEVACEATSRSALGTYPVVVSGAEAQNYDISYVNGTLTIIEADPIMVTVTDCARLYGDENPAFEYTVEGGTLNGEPMITCEADETSPVGTYDIVITEGTVENFNVTYVKGTLTVDKAPLTISAGEYTMKQGDPLPEFEAGFEGFKNDDTADVMTKQPVFSTEATSRSDLGTYAVVVSGAEAQNYEISYAEGTLTIIEADPITVTVENCTRLYGDENPAVYGYTVEGGVLDGAPLITCEATPESPVGTYDIVISEGTVQNFNVTYVGGTLTVEKAPLTISAGEYTMKQGDPLPEFEAKYEGFKNGETDEVLTKQPVFACEATSSSDLGTYTVTVSGAEAQNYDISYMEGTLTITDADLITVTVTNCSRGYGDENPVFEYTVDGGELVGEPVITCEATPLSPVGTYDIVIGKGTVQNFNVAYAGGTLTVEKALLTIGGGTYTIKQGEPMPEFYATYEGFKNGETEEVLTKLPVLTCEVTSSWDAPSMYGVTPSGAEAENYDFYYMDGDLYLLDADPAEVTVQSYTRLYGDENPEFEYVAEGWYLGGEPEIVCEATPESPVGTYEIIAYQGTVQNMNVQYYSGTLTIEKAPLVASVGDYSRVQYEENPEFVVLFEGFRNGDTEDVLEELPVATTEATPDSPAGVYAVTVSGGKAQNYDFEYQDGTLTVIKYDGIDHVVTLDHPVDVYSIQGTVVRHDTTSLAGLPRGIYVVQGRKVTVR